MYEVFMVLLFVLPRQHHLAVTPHQQPRQTLITSELIALPLQITKHPIKHCLSDLRKRYV